MTAWTLFYNPIALSWGLELWLLLPLCAAVGIVYKTIRVQHLRQLVREIVFLMGYMVVGLAALCLGLWLVQKYWP